MKDFNKMTSEMRRAACWIIYKQMSFMNIETEISIVREMVSKSAGYNSYSDFIKCNEGKTEHEQGRDT